MLCLCSKASSVRLFDDLSWLPFYEEATISKRLIAFKRLPGEPLTSITRLLTSKSDFLSRNTWYANYNLVCSHVNHGTVSLSPYDKRYQYKGLKRQFFIGNQHSLNHFIV